MGKLRPRRLASSLLIVRLLALCVHAAELEFTDLDGALHRPLQAGTNKATVLVFILSDCPVANSYAPEINRLVADYTPRRVQFFLVHVDPALGVAEARQHTREFGFQCPVLIDRQHSLVQRTGVTVTPEAVVLAPDGRRLYRGRIDDRQVALGKRRPQPTRRDLREALDALLAGKPIKTAETKAVGCYIPSLDGSKK
jgi:hypothetical protein